MERQQIIWWSDLPANTSVIDLLNAQPDKIRWEDISNIDLLEENQFPYYDYAEIIRRMDIIRNELMEKIWYLSFDHKSVESIEECPICFSKTPSIITSCNHQYCKKCIDEWMKKSNSCPCCRGNLDTENLFLIKSE